MIVGKLHKVDSPLSVLHEIPTTFFANLERATNFDDSLFPAWTNSAFSNQTLLKSKFKSIYEKYKGISSVKTRKKIIKAFSQSNQIESLCKNNLKDELIYIKDFPTIQKEIDSAFLYLYKDALNHPPFEKLYKDTISEAVDRFISKNGYSICPICGIEGYNNLVGQARIDLDHWLYKDLFPFTAVNFDNLIPLGDKCNGRPAKGTKNVLLDETQTNRTVAYYPYSSNKGIKLSFDFTSDPKSTGILDDDWNLSINPIEATEKSIFDSWLHIFCITDRFEDFFRKVIFDRWEDNYKKFVNANPMMTHANDITEFRKNLLVWNSIFQVESYPGAILYRIFIDYLVNRASDSYLYGLCENFKRS